MIDRRTLAQLDWVLITVTLLIAATGVTMIHSATYPKGAELQGLYLRQLSWLGVGVLAAALLLLTDYRVVHRYGFLLYGIALVLLILVPVLGKTVSGAKRWLALGPIRLQPSEFVKLAVVIALARHFSDEDRRGLLRLRDLGIPTVLILVPALLVARQPDLGTALVIVLVGLVVILAAGLRMGTILALGVSLAAAAPVVWLFLKGYQKERVLTVIQGGDPLGAGYHGIQAKIAIGSGGLLGKGLLAGTQSQLHFLPEQHTDFIFAVLAEEAGFAGSMWLLTLYAILVIQGINIAFRSRDLSGTLLAAGVVGLLSLHIILNIAMTSGLLPIVGLPLPFMSYGGSALVVDLLAIGLLLNIRMRRFTF
ncbi:MAG: rod shape-determining protein RodA [Candidatus Tectomicrobia bacterium]|nr:rod shape-determining protein RodA [Candidatus Tectomicrobia bacterium]